MTTPNLPPLTTEILQDIRRRVRIGEAVTLTAREGAWEEYFTPGGRYAVTCVDGDGDLVLLNDDGNRRYLKVRDSPRRHWFGLAPAATQGLDTDALKQKLSAKKTDKLIRVGRNAEADLAAIQALLAERAAGLL